MSRADYMNPSQNKTPELKAFKGGRYSYTRPT